MTSRAKRLRLVRYSSALKNDSRHRPRKPLLALQRTSRSPDPPEWKTELRQRKSPKVTLPKL